MKDPTWLVLLGVAVAVTVPFACDDSLEAGPGSGSGVGGGGNAGPAGSGQGGGAVCGEDCTVHCGAPIAEGNGDCVAVGGPVECNPVTNDGCIGGQVCDFGPGGFQCLPGDGLALCAPCSATVHCGAGLTCSPFGVCAKFCCYDGDCGPEGHCEYVPNVGAGTCAKGGNGPTSTVAEASSAEASSGAGGGMGGGGVGGAAVSSAVSSSAVSSSAVSASASSSSSAGVGGAGGI